MLFNVISKAKIYIAKYNDMDVAVKASLWFAICSILQKTISFLTMPIFTRLMSIEQYGQYNIFLTWYSILALFISLNLHSEIFNKGLVDNLEKKDEYTNNQIGLLILLTIISLCIYLPFKNTINQALGLSTFLMVIMILEILSSSVIGIWLARQRFDFKYNIIVKITLGMSIVTLSLGVIMVSFSDDKSVAKILSNAIVPMVISFFLLCNLRKNGSFFNNFKWWKLSVFSAIPLVPHYLSLVLLNQSDKLMINAFCGADKAAIYSVAHTAGLIMTIINNSINASFVPWAYNKMKLYNGDGIKDISKSLLSVVWLVNVLLIWVAPEAIMFLAPPQYAEAAYCLIPIAISVYFYFAYTMFVDIEIYFGSTYLVATASMLAAVVNVILNYIFIPMYGYLVAGYTTLISYFLTMLLHYVFLRLVFIKHSFNRVLFSEKTILGYGSLLILAAFIIGSMYEYVVLRYSLLVLVLAIIWKFKNSILSKLADLRRK